MSADGAHGYIQEKGEKGPVDFESCPWLHTCVPSKQVTPDSSTQHRGEFAHQCSLVPIRSGTERFASQNGWGRDYINGLVCGGVEVLPSGLLLEFDRCEKASTWCGKVNKNVGNIRPPEMVLPPW